MTGTYDEIQEFFEGDDVMHPFVGPIAEMTDGLHITPPTEDRVARMLEGTSHSPDEVIEFRAWGRGGRYIASVKKVAINAVMAGCKPEQMPAVLALAEAGACVGYPGDSSFGHMFVVSGPYAKEIGMNSGFCYLCPGNSANMALQRACTLMGINLGGARIGVNVLERTGPLHWGTIFAENEDSPWKGLNEYYGYGPDESVLLSWDMKVQLIPFQNIEVKSAESLRENQPGTPEHAIAALKTLTNHRGALLAFTPDTARFWVKEYGFKTMNELQEYMYEHVTWRKGVRSRNYWLASKGSRRPPKGGPPKGGPPKGPPPGRDFARYKDLPDDADIPMFSSPSAITIIVAGGTGDAWTWGGASRSPRVISIDKWRYTTTAKKDITLPETKPGLYVNEEYCFSVTYPESWKNAPAPNQKALLFVSIDGFRTNPNLSVYLPQSVPGKLEDLPIKTPKMLADKYPNTSNHEVVSEKMITLDCGTQAIEFVIAWNWSGTDINTTIVVAEAGDRLIWVDSTSLGREPMDINRKLTNSLRFYK